MIWREPTNHADDCYFCIKSLVGFNRKNRKNILYHSISSARRPIPHSNENPVPVFKELLNIPVSATSLAKDSTLQELTESDTDAENQNGDDDIDYHGCLIEPQRFNQDYLSDLIRDLNLPKESAELLASRLNEIHLLLAKTRATFYRHRDAEFVPYFKQYDEIVVCNDVEPLLVKLGIDQYDVNSWLLFIDSSKRSLKCVLLHSTNEYASIPIGHLTTLKEKYGPIKHVLEYKKYDQHNWKICVDLKMVNFLLGQQSGYRKYPCFFDERSKLYTFYECA